MRLTDTILILLCSAALLINGYAIEQFKNDAGALSNKTNTAHKLSRRANDECIRPAPISRVIPRISDDEWITVLKQIVNCLKTIEPLKEPEFPYAEIKCTEIKAVQDAVMNEPESDDWAVAASAFANCVSEEDSKLACQRPGRIPKFKGSSTWFDYDDWAEISSALYYCLLQEKSINVVAQKNDDLISDREEKETFALSERRCIEDVSLPDAGRLESIVAIKELASFFAACVISEDDKIYPCSRDDKIPSYAITPVSSMEWAITYMKVAYCVAHKKPLDHTLYPEAPLDAFVTDLFREKQHRVVVVVEKDTKSVSNPLQEKVLATLSFTTCVRPPDIPPAESGDLDASQWFQLFERAKYCTQTTMSLRKSEEWSEIEKDCVNEYQAFLDGGEQKDKILLKYKEKNLEFETPVIRYIKCIENRRRQIACGRGNIPKTLKPKKRGAGDWEDLWELVQKCNKERRPILSPIFTPQEIACSTPVQVQAFIDQAAEINAKTSDLIAKFNLVDEASDLFYYCVKERPEDEVAPIRARTEILGQENLLDAKLEQFAGEENNLNVWWLKALERSLLRPLNEILNIYQERFMNGFAGPQAGMGSMAFQADQAETVNYDIMAKEKELMYAMQVYASQSTTREAFYKTSIVQNEALVRLNELIDKQKYSLSLLYVDIPEDPRQYMIEENEEDEGENVDKVGQLEAGKPSQKRRGRDRIYSFVKKVIHPTARKGSGKDSSKEGSQNGSQNSIQNEQRRRWRDRIKAGFDKAKQKLKDGAQKILLPKKTEFTFSIPPPKDDSRNVQVENTESSKDQKADDQNADDPADNARDEGENQGKST